MTPREIVQRTLRFQHPPRLPRTLWISPWAGLHHPEHVAALRRRWPDDVVGAPDVYRRSPRVRGDRYAVGSSTDAWGCVFENLQAGIHGEVRTPICPDISRWRETVLPPYEVLPDDPVAATALVDAFCRGSDRFVLAGCCPRPWERYQFLRGTEAALIDLAEDSADSRDLLAAITAYDRCEIDFWCGTAVDGVFFMDDWGSQRDLLVSPRLWRRVFKPIYADYVARIHAAGKAAFLHSDGNILAILPDLVEIGVDALNSQLGCMDLTEVARIARGRLAFWGEIDRQQVLPGDPAGGRAEVQRIAHHLCDPAGGCFVMFEYGPGARPETVDAVLAAWEEVQAAARST